MVYYVDRNNSWKYILKITPKENMEPPDLWHIFEYLYFSNFKSSVY